MASRVKVQLVGVLGSAAQHREMDLEWSDSLTVSKVIENLLKTINNRQFEDLLIDSGTHDPRPNVIILLDEQDCNLFSGLKTLVDRESTVTIIPVAHGG
jgi:molybdopterin converting factor small subunit